MKWELVSKPTAELQEYHLIKNDSCAVILKYNPRQNSARVSCGNHNRLFFVESAGSLSGKTLISNEYGFQIGSMGYEKWNSKEGTIIIDDLKYSYRFNNNPLAELTIFENNTKKQLVSCGLNALQKNAEISFTNNTLSANNNCLLLGLCWYLFLPVAKENIVEFAAK